MVVLEAMNQGLPVVCLKLGGPGALVNESCGYVVDPAGKDTAQVVREMGDALIGLSRDFHTTSACPGGETALPRLFPGARKVVRIYGLAP